MMYEEMMKKEHDAGFAEGLEAGRAENREMAAKAEAIIARYKALYGELDEKVCLTDKREQVKD